MASVSILTHLAHIVRLRSNPCREENDGLDREYHENSLHPFMFLMAPL